MGGFHLPSKCAFRSRIYRIRIPRDGCLHLIVDLTRLGIYRQEGIGSDEMIVRREVLKCNDAGSPDLRDDE